MTRFRPSLVLYERPVPVFFKCDTQLFLGIHDDWTVPGYGFTNGLPRDQEEPDGICVRRDLYLVTIIKQHERPIAHDRVSLHIEVIDPLRLVGKRLLLFAEVPLSFYDVRENGMPASCSQREFRGSGDSDVQVLGVGNDVSNWPLVPG